MADMVFEMIQDADIDTRAEYYKHIVLSGQPCVVVCVVCGVQWVEGCLFCCVTTFVEFETECEVFHRALM